MPIDNPCSTLMMKFLIENYFTVEEKGYEIPDQTSTLFLKDGLVRKFIIFKRIYSFILGERYQV